MTNVQIHQIALFSTLFSLGQILGGSGATLLSANKGTGQNAHLSVRTVDHKSPGTHQGLSPKGTGTYRNLFPIIKKCDMAWRFMSIDSIAQKLNELKPKANCESGKI